MLMHSQYSYAERLRSQHAELCPMGPFSWLTFGRAAGRGSCVCAFAHCASCKARLLCLTPLSLRPTSAAPCR